MQTWMLPAQIEQQRWGEHVIFCIGRNHDHPIRRVPLASATAEANGSRFDYKCFNHANRSDRTYQTNATKEETRRR